MDINIIFYLQIDGQYEWMIQILEDTFWGFLIDFGNHWDQHISFVKFAYNNIYHSIWLHLRRYIVEGVDLQLIGLMSLT